MEIKDKNLFKTEVRKKVEKYIKEFPVYFFGNIIINLILLIFFVAVAFASAFILKIDPRLSMFGAVFLAFLTIILKITLKDLSRNFRILKNIKAGHYAFEIEDYELDNVIEFLESLPLKKASVEEMKISLSFGKLIDILNAADIISYRSGVCDINIVFKYEFEIKDGEI